MTTPRDAVPAPDPIDISISPVWTGGPPMPAYVIAMIDLTKPGRTFRSTAERAGPVYTVTRGATGGRFLAEMKKETTSHRGDCC